MPQPPNNRVLAAIVFTDTVGYTHRMQIEEEKTIALVKRDLTMFEKICLAAGGRTIKNTGDGLLMFFPSLDSALKTGTGILEYLDTASRTFTPDKRLQHRLGIHLGDVITSPTDVLGDGVNIASRLMGEAQPDTICISYFAFDFIKNRTKLHPEFIGPRQLKNIKDPVTAVLLSYRPPLGVLLPPDPESSTISPKSKPPLTLPAKILYFGAPTFAALIMLAVYLFNASTPKDNIDTVSAGSETLPIQLPPTTSPSSTPSTSSTSSTPSTPSTSSTSSTPDAINLLPLIDIDRDTIRGNWTRTPDGSLRCEAAGMSEPFAITTDSPSAARIALPLTPDQIPREYDFNVSFTRNDGQASIALIFTAGQGTAVFEVDAWGRNLGGIQTVGGRNMQAYPENTFTQRFEPGKRYNLSLQVRKDKLNMLVDGKEMASIPSDGSDLSLQFWAMKKENPLGIGAFKSSATFHSIQIVPLK
jgi:class 3 adenylate cyclase